MGVIWGGFKHLRKLRKSAAAGFHNRHSGAARSVEPQMCNCTSGNLEIPRCAIAHLRSGPSDHPGMTESSTDPFPVIRREKMQLSRHYHRGCVMNLG